MKVKKLLSVLVLLIPGLAIGQSVTVSSNVRDRETKEPLSFASVGIKGQAIGTISNAQGEFDFHFPVTMRNETLVISMLGYQNFEAPIWSLLEKPDSVILMDKSPIILEEIVVSDTLNGGDVLRIALSRIEDNYPMQPFALDGFYRDVKKVGGTHISLLEAAVKVYDDSYAEPRNKYKLRERVRLIEVRKSLGYESKFTTYFDQDNLLEDLLLHNNVRYRQIMPDDELLNGMVRDRNSYYDGHEIYVISYNKDYKLKLYVDKVDFSIVHLEWERGPDQGFMGRKKNFSSQFGGMKKSLDFRRYQGKMYLSFMNMTTKVNWYDSETGRLKFETELLQQLLINKVELNPKERMSTTEKMRNYGLQYQDQAYNKKFWDNYNVIKDTPLDQKIILDLEKLGPLEKQFAEY